MRHKQLAVLLFCTLAVPAGTAGAQVNADVDYFEIDGDYGSSIGQYVTGGGLDVRDGGYTAKGSVEASYCTDWLHITSSPYMGPQSYSTYCGDDTESQVRRSEQQMMISLTGGNGQPNPRYFTFAFRLSGLSPNPPNGDGAYIAQWHQSSDRPPPVRLNWTARNGRYYLALGVSRDVEDGNFGCRLESETIGYDEVTRQYTHEILPGVWYRVLLVFDAGPKADFWQCADCLGTSGTVSLYLMDNLNGDWDLVEGTYRGRVGWAYNGQDKNGDKDSMDKDNPDTPLVNEDECSFSRRNDQNFEWNIGQYFASPGVGFLAEYDNVAYAKSWSRLTKNRLVGYQKSVLRYRFQETGTTVNDHSYYWNNGSAGDPLADYNNDGTVIGSRIATGGLSGGSSGGMWFNGASYVRRTLGASELDDFDFGNYATVSAWFKTTSVSGYRGLVVIDESSTDWKVRLLAHNGAVAFGVRHPDNTTSVVSAAGSFGDGRWHHAVGVFNRFSDERLKLYVDGNLVGSSTGSARPILRGANQLVVGKYSSSSYFVGAIDEVNVFHFAMTDDDVYSLFLERDTP